MYLATNDTFCYSEEQYSLLSLLVLLTYHSHHDNIMKVVEPRFPIPHSIRTLLEPSTRFEPCQIDLFHHQNHELRDDILDLENLKHLQLTLAMYMGFKVQGTFSIVYEATFNELQI